MNTIFLLDDLAEELNCDVESLKHFFGFMVIES
jgi:hypothetical protein